MRITDVRVGVFVGYSLEFRAELLPLSDPSHLRLPNKWDGCNRILSA